MVYKPVTHSTDKLGHFCGVVGIYSDETSNIPEKLFYPLFSLQHRGQESAGIAYRRRNRIVAYKGLGMVSSVLAHYLAEDHPSQVGIGHVRYSTQGGNRVENAQPIHVTCNKGQIALAHNGNISNSGRLKAQLVDEGSIFQGTSDTELILHLISRSRQKDFPSALQESLGLLEGAYSLVMVHEDTLYAVRDPLGFRPLYVGSKEGTTIVASETCALEVLGVTDRREVEPGETIQIGPEGVRSTVRRDNGNAARCVFELIYFSRPDSLVFDRNVHMMRKRIGAALARVDTYQGDIVVPVPDSGNSAAIGYAEAAGLPFDLGLARNHYAGRSFILPTTSQRELAVRIKLHPVGEAIRGKRVILVDDSLVRGTTSRTLVKLMKESGAREIHLRLSSPELRYPCYFGIDIPTREELISNRLSPEQIAEHIGADSVMFLPIERLRECVADAENYCFACFSGEYPVEPAFV